MSSIFRVLISYLDIFFGEMSIQLLGPFLKLGFLSVVELWELFI